MKKSKSGDDRASESDPLDLGSDHEDVRAPGPGRNRKSILDRTRAAYWAWTVQMTAGKTFSKLERELALRPFPRRDGGGFEQPHAMSKYARGERCPIPPSKGDASPVVRAEARYPGTRAAYDSITWDLLYDPKSPLAKRLRLTSRISPYVLERIKPEHIQKKDRYRLLLTHEGIAHLVFIRHLDAFGLILMQWRNLDWDRADICMIYLARTWLLLSFQWMEPFVTCRRLLMKLIHQNVGELGPLNGLNGLDPKKATNERVSDAFFAAFVGGLNVADS